MENYISGKLDFWHTKLPYRALISFRGLYSGGGGGDLDAQRSLRSEPHLGRLLRIGLTWGGRRPHVT